MGILMKMCSLCKEIKHLSDFSPHKHTKDKHCCACRKCNASLTKEYRNNNREKVKKANAQYRLMNKEKIKEAMKKWRANNQLILKEKKHQYEKDHRGILNKSAKKWRDEHPEKMREYSEKYNKKNRSTARGKLNLNVSSVMRQSLRKSKANRHWEELVDFTVGQLKKHLEKRFRGGMTWENYGTYWHIDHKIPIAAFNYEHPKDIDFRLCWSLKNLQPLESTKKH